MSKNANCTLPSQLASPTLVKLEVGEINDLIGKILTIVDASIGEQKKAESVKSLVKQSVWSWAQEWRAAATKEAFDEFVKEAQKVEGFDVGTLQEQFKKQYGNIPLE